MKNKYLMLLLIGITAISSFSCTRRKKGDSELTSVSSEVLTKSLINLSTKTTKLNPGNEFTIKVTCYSRYQDKYWSSSNVWLYCSDYSLLDFVKWKLSDTSGGAEDLMGEGLSETGSNNYYQCGVVYENNKYSSKKIVEYNVTFKLKNDVNTQNVLNIGFYLKYSTANIFTYCDKTDERKQEIDISHGVENQLIIPIEAKN